MDIKAPTFPESISEGTVAVWHKRPGDPVSRDDLLVDIETDKVVLEVVAPADGALIDILKDEGEIVESEEVIAHFEAGEVAAPAAEAVSGESEAASGEPVSASPAARKLADESGIDIQSLSGSGKAGRMARLVELPKTMSRKRSAPVPAKRRQRQHPHPSRSSRPRPHPQVKCFRLWTARSGSSAASQ
jgi:2-oxoglutarate dehydrogenase E2 component (dihydrolipoamide succinyltransferase)